MEGGVDERSGDSPSALALEFQKRPIPNPRAAQSEISVLPKTRILHEQDLFFVGSRSSRDVTGRTFPYGKKSPRSREFSHSRRAEQGAHKDKHIDRNGARGDPDDLPWGGEAVRDEGGQAREAQPKARRALFLHRSSGPSQAPRLSTTTSSAWRARPHLARSGVSSSRAVGPVLRVLCVFLFTFGHRGPGERG